MRGRGFVKRALLWLIVISVFLSLDITKAEETRNIIDADITVEMSDGTNFSVSTEISITKFSLEASGTTYTGEEIKNNIAGTETMGAIKYALRSLLLNQIKDTFENADVTPETELPDYNNEKFYDSFQVYLSSNYFGINQSITSYELINGVLDMGGQVNYSFNLQAEEGWNNTYIINLGEELRHIVFTDGKVSGNNIEWKVLNGNGEQPTKTAILRIKDPDPTTSFKNEKINLDLKLDTRQKKTVFETNISAEAIDIREYNFLPGFITDLEYVPSDGIRLFIKNNIIEWNKTIYEKTLKEIINDIKTTVKETKFNQTLDLDFRWDPSSTTNCENCYDINKMNAEPPLTTSVLDEDVDITIYDISTRALYGLVKTGGVANISEEDINFGSNLTKIGYPYNITIFLPENVFLNDKNRYTWNNTIKFEGIMQSEEVPNYQNEEKDTTIEIDIKNSDLNILGFFTGNPELNFGLNIVETKNINVTTIPDEFNVPEKIDIKYLNSDAMRLCIKENVFSESEIKAFLEKEKNSFEKRLPQIISKLKINGKINRNSFDESINKELNFSDMDKDPSVNSEVYANTIHPVKYDYSLIPPSFEIPIQKYSFRGLENQSVTYRISFPKGLSVNIKNSSLDRVKVKETKDGREYIEISFTSDESDLVSTVSCKLTPSWLFLIGLFMPCIITFLIVIILVIVILIIRKRRKYKKPAPAYEKREEDYEGYDEEDYYVPPPPGSK